MKLIRSITVLVLTMLFVFTLFPTASFADRIEADVASAEVVLGNSKLSQTGSSALTDTYLNRVEANSNDPLPAQYDGRDYGYVPPIREQYWNHGTCWVFAAIACAECNLIKNGVINPETGNPATTSDVDLSETALAYFHFSDAHDKLGMLEGDRSIPLGLDYLRNCDLGSAVALTLMRWTGPVSETYPAVNNNSNLNATGISAEYGCNYDFAHVESVEWIPMSDREAIKRAIMEYGAATVGLTVDPSYVNYDTDGYYFPQKAASSRQIDHFLAIVGWDDSFPTSSFSRYASPSQSGAWICKNSQGRFSPTDDNYLYVSYEDYFMSTDTCYFYKVGNLDNYQYNYQYDGTCNDASYLGADNGVQIANVFTANGHETMKAAAVNILDKGTSYTLDIYKNPSSRNPSSGTKVSSQTGSFNYPGYYTIPLNVPVELNAGDTFSVVFTLNSSAGSSSDGKAVHLAYDCSASVDHVQWVHVDRGDTSFYKTSGGTWTDCPSNGDFRLKAYTDDYVPTVSYTVSAESNNNAYGTVSVVGNTIVASPAPGYVVSGCEVVAGSATYTIEGNTIHVSPGSDCTIRVIFAAAPTCTVNLMACGVKIDSRDVLPNGTTVLPSAVPQTPDGWTFCGWSAQPVAETSSEPTHYAPGATYTVTGNATLYALFTCTQGNSELGFQLLNTTPDTWEGNYVITYTANPGTMRVLKSTASTSVIGISSSTYAPVLASTGMTLNQDVLTNVSTAYQFTFSAHGGAYWLRNVSTGSYLGGTTVLYACAERYTSFMNWNLSFQNGTPLLRNTYKNNYLSFNTGNGGYFCLTSGTDTNIRLWKEMPIGATYYSTEFVSSHTHSVQFVPAVAPTCTEAGLKAYYFCNDTACPLFGQKFADEGLTVELTALSVPALGHNPGASVEENRTEPTATTDGGFDTVVYCTRCNAELSREHTVLPATGAHEHTMTYVPAVAPTCAEAGHSAYYVCTGCNKTFSDLAGAHEIALSDTVIPATGNHTYGEWISTRYGTHYHVCSVCNAKETVPCTYVDVVTPPTTTDQGYTTHTCTFCGFRYVDSYIAPIEPDYVVTFSVPTGVAPVASMTCKPNTAITLPVADAPAGYTFLGWVHTAVTPTTEAPGNIMTGGYEPACDTTLYALYTYTDGNGQVGFQRLTSAPDTWEGNYVITYTANAGTMRVLKSIKSTSVVGISSSTYAPALASTGMTLNQDVLTNVSTAYQFTISAKGSGMYWLQNVSTGSYLGGTTVLYACAERYTCFLNWTLSFQNGAPVLHNTYKNNNLSFNTGNGGYFCLVSGTNTNINLWKEMPIGATYFATVIN